MTVYGFMFCDCIYESASETMSLHTTKVGAYRAMRAFIYEACQEHENSRIRWGKEFGDNKHGIHQSWGVESFEVLEN